MKKNTIKAFTLVEMLIVIVIIGILIAALMPRMQAAQGRARDVARKTALSQVQSAIVVWQGDNGKWPGMGTTNDPSSDAITLDNIAEELKTAGLNGVPKDPLGDTSFVGLNCQPASGSEFQYMVTTRNGTQKGGFVLMAKTEVPGGSNYVVDCKATDPVGKLTPSSDISDPTQFSLCQTLSKSGVVSNDKKGNCTYESEEDLRYVVTY